MRLPIYLASALTLLFGSAAHAQSPVVPAAPHVTVGADLKQLIFDWNPVLLATHYQVLVNADGHSGYTPLGDPIPATQTRATIGIAVHLQRWANALYIVSACNLAGCHDSAPIFPRDQMLDTIGYFKASNSDASDQFGYALALSSDGSTLAVTSHNEASIATGINGTQSDNSSPNSGAVFVFRRISGHWQQEAYIKGVTLANWFGWSFAPYPQTLSLNNDGSMLVIAEPLHDTNGVGTAGEVGIYRRASNGSWSRSAALHAPDITPAGYFGQSVDVSLDGLTLRVAALQPRINGAGVGTTYLYKRTGNTWALTNTFAPYYPGDRCEYGRMSGDGNTLVSNCVKPDNTNRVITLKHSGASWVHAPDVSLPDQSTQPFALNSAGTVLALVDDNAVGVYRWSGSAWTRESLIPAPNLTTDIFVGFGQAMAFDKAGNTLAIGDYNSPAGGAGVMTAASQSNTHDGAVFVYGHTSSASKPWVLRSVVKAPNPANQDLFGISLALCGTGRTLAVGAYRESSAARGIDGNRTNAGAPESGAVYLY